MKTYVGGRPGISIRDLRGRSGGARDVFPLNQPRCHYFYSGRYALIAGVRALGIGKGDAVLVPAYNCGVEVDSMRFLGIRPVFYKVKADLQVDLEDLERRLNGEGRGVLLTHFFGFPQFLGPIREMCERKKVFLIEDCAHAFLSKSGVEDLGSTGDVGIFSLLKSLPVPNGGALVMNTGAEPGSFSEESPSLFASVFWTTELIQGRSRGEKPALEDRLSRGTARALNRTMKVVRFLLAGGARITGTRARFLARPDTQETRPEILNWKMSRISWIILGKLDLGEVVRKRRENFRFLLDYFLKRWEECLIRKDLPAGVCPLLFPILVRDREERSRIYSMLQEAGVCSHPWWAWFHEGVPWRDFPEAVLLKERILGLPVHQDLDEWHLRFMVDQIERVLAHNLRK
jgi:dTDP-4-amino-4,6-dideoxygalactose transaminase